MNKKLTDNQITELLRKASDSLKLSDTEKGIMKAELNDVIKSGSQIGERSIIKNILNQRKLTMPLIPMIIAIVIALGGGTAALADMAKPGDFLYPVDTFVENFVESLTKSDESLAILHAERVEERMQELEALGKIDPASLTEKRATMLEKHKERLAIRLENRINKTKHSQEVLQLKLEELDNEHARKGLENAFSRLEEIGARQEIMIGRWKEPGIELPLIDPKVRAKLEAQRKAYSQRTEELRKKLREMWGNKEIEIINPKPINPVPEPMVLDSNDVDDSVEDEDKDDDDTDILDSLLAI